MLAFLLSPMSFLLPTVVHQGFRIPFGFPFLLLKPPRYSCLFLLLRLVSPSFQNGPFCTHLFLPSLLLPPHLLPFPRLGSPAPPLSAESIPPFCTTVVPPLPCPSSYAPSFRLVLSFPFDRISSSTSSASKLTCDGTFCYILFVLSISFLSLPITPFRAASVPPSASHGATYTA